MASAACSHTAPRAQTRSSRSARSRRPSPGSRSPNLRCSEKSSLDEPLRPILFPDIADGPHETQITLLDLATHRSGLPSVPDNLVPKDPATHFLTTIASRFIDFLARHGTAKPPDAKYLYSSMGIGLLGYARPQRAGVPYSQLIRAEITGPLRMNDTVFALSPEQERRLLQGHGDSLEPVDAGFREGGIFAGAIGAKSTAEDLLTWLDANLHPERYVAGAAPGSPGATLPAAFAIDHQLRGTVKPNTEVAFSWLFDVESGPLRARRYDTRVYCPRGIHTGAGSRNRGAVQSDG